MLGPHVKVGDRVRKLARRNHRGSLVLGIVVELFEREGRVWARIASGQDRKVTTAWPVLRLRRIEEEEES